MTYVYNDPAEFKNDVLKGFAAAYPQYVSRVEGASGFTRAGGPLEGKVSLVIGGGSGHYPSYNGVVGTGFADGAVLGDLFASPSAEQVYRIAKAAHGGAGVVFGFGNYAGDRLNFGVAADRLRAEGIDTRIVYVTDDIASAAPDEQGKRRGIAGTFTVYKIAAAAAEDGANLDEVERVMTKANAATYSFGVAFAGCTMPGADQPLFIVEPGQMDFGLGIHGEPGISSAPWMNAKDLATKLVQTVLAERPDDANGRAAVLVNGLGATKYEELYALFGDIAELLQAGRGGAGRAGGGRARDEPGHGRLFAVDHLAGRGVGGLLDSTGRHPGVPPRHHSSESEVHNAPDSDRETLASTSSTRRARNPSPQRRSRGICYARSARPSRRTRTISASSTQ